MDRQIDTITYGDIIKKFREAYPHIKINDYRPADYMPDTIIVWEDGTDKAYLVNYQVTWHRVFILGVSDRKV